jgi:hypothetical protein
MDDAFACPECSAPVQIAGLAPGRQVRCGFCGRLLEVPYLPRVVKTDWRRRRFGRPWWVAWAWAGLALAAAVVLLISIVQMLARHERASLERSIADLVASSQAAEAGGNLAKALVDLDAAIALRAGSGSETAGHQQLQSLRERRLVLNRREASAILDRLKGLDATSLPLGDWLNLKARAEADRALSGLALAVQQALRQKLLDRIALLLKRATAALAAGKPSDALRECEAVMGLLAHLPPDDQRGMRQQVEPVVEQAIAQYGIVVDPIRVQTLYDRRAPDNTRMQPTISRAVAARGYLPQPASSPWKDRWAKAPYRLVIELNERYDGTYLTSENRLTRIDARLLLLDRGQQVWTTTPSARTPVPLPGLPAYLSGQIALSQKRSAEFEQLLYDNARTSILDKVAFSVDHMPTCSRTPN